MWQRALHDPMFWILVVGWSLFGVIGSIAWVKHVAWLTDRKE